MRIVFIGSVEFSLRALEKLVALDAEIVGVCTLQESKFNADHVDLRGFCEAHGIPSLYLDDINSIKTLTWIRGRSPDIIFCFGWSRLIKKDLLELPPLGIVGFHPSLLPANRGRHPLIWALVLGLKKTGSTFFFMNSVADSGDILSQKEISIDDQDNARTLYDKVIRAALIQMTELMPQLIAGTFQRTVQNENLSNVWRKRDRLDGQIDWRMSAQSIHNLVRGLSVPYAGAHFLLNGKEVKVLKTAVVLDVPNNVEPGKVLFRSCQGAVVKCGMDAISLLITEPELNETVGSYL
ncbi:MAG: formyl transferase [Burkholderiaceae bacterium]|nr:formyl transferase [Burkholderiaceae bacterium]